MKTKFLFVVLILTIISCQSNPQRPETAEENLPQNVANLIMPSGFDSGFVTSIINGEPVRYVKPVIRIANFTVPNTFKNAIRDPNFSMDAFLKDEIAKTGRYVLLGSEGDIQAAIAEQRRASSDFFADDGTVEIGNLRLAGFVLNGEISQSYPIVTQVGGHFSLKVSVSVSLSVVDANTGVLAYTRNIEAVNEELLFVSAEGMIIRGPRNLTNKPINSLNATGADIDLGPQYRLALQEATRKTINFLEEKHPVMGEVLGLSGRDIMTTASENNGIKPGDYLFIVRIGDPLKDSSGRILGFNKTMIGAARVTTVERNMSTATIVRLQDQSILPSQRDIIISLPATAQ